MRRTVSTALTLYAALVACAPTALPNLENAAAVAQYEHLLDDCKARGKAANSYAVYATCADDVDHRLCRESGQRCTDAGAR